MTVFAGLMLGSLVASLNMTLVAPALPTIVSELGGLADYSWVPIAALTLVVIWFFMHVPNERRPHAIDVWGSVTLSLAIAATLLATVWGGVQYPWTSWQILGLYSVAGLLLAAFVWIELHAAEPVLPLKLWTSSIFTFSNIASVSVAMSMFGAIFFLPVFVQGVVGNSVTNSGAILVPMLVAMIVTSVAGGQLISRTGRYKPQLLAGLAVMGVGYFLLSTFDINTTNQEVIVAMILIGLGLGTSMQTYVLIVPHS